MHACRIPSLEEFKYQTFELYKSVGKSSPCRTPAPLQYHLHYQIPRDVAKNIKMTTADERAKVQLSWAKTYCRWDDREGYEFYKRLFASSATIKAAFENFGATNPGEMRKQAILFGLMLTQFVDNLNDPTALKHKICGMIATHKTKKITDPELFAFALDQLVEFIGNEKAAWRKVTAVILAEMRSALKN